MQEATSKKQFTSPEQIHNKFFNPVEFTEIDYLPSCSGMDIQHDIFVADGCLVITQALFDQFYQQSMSQLSNGQLPSSTKIILTDIVLAMNGENMKCYNIKKQLITEMSSLCNSSESSAESVNQHKEKLIAELDKQLQLNSAICMKNKKTSSCYEFRMFLLHTKLSLIANQGQILFQIHERERKLITRVLSRFLRNYFCWMFRLRLMKMLTAHLELHQLHSVNKLFQIQIQCINSHIQKSNNDYSAFSYLRFLIRSCPGHKEQVYRNQLEWGEKLLQFCMIAYEMPAQYRHLTQYIEDIKQKQGGL